jgi:hypothetical protein
MKTAQHKTKKNELLNVDYTINLVKKTWSNSPIWYRREASLAVQRGAFLPILGRNDQNLYLLRMWITPPVLRSNGELESENSLLLHLFARGDDDAALHTHPYQFTTTILCGSYTEYMPPLYWNPKHVHGPVWNEYKKFRQAGDTVTKELDELHCVGECEPGTMTLLRTGKRLRIWGFHPPGKPFVTSEEFLDSRK